MTRPNFEIRHFPDTSLDGTITPTASLWRMVTGWLLFLIVIPFLLLLFEFGNSWFAQYFSGGHKLFQDLCVPSTNISFEAACSPWVMTAPVWVPILRRHFFSWPTLSKRTQSGGVPCTPLGFFDHFKVNDVILSTHACSKPEQLASEIRSCATKRYRKGCSNTITFLQLCYGLFSRKF